ncbi:MAG: hypothetical protein AB1671_13140 [Thermodesulfobacteriota bacterium]
MEKATGDLDGVFGDWLDHDLVLTGQAHQHFAPRFQSDFFRISAGITICPLAEVFTIGIFVHLFV